MVISIMKDWVSIMKPVMRINLKTNYYVSIR